jgi:hypothetical protein
MAVLRNMASMMGAGPLMVMETEVLGAHRSNPPYKHLHIIQGADADTGIADLAVDIRPPVRIEAIEGHRIEGRGEPSWPGFRPTAF